MSSSCHKLWLWAAAVPVSVSSSSSGPGPALASCKSRGAGRSHPAATTTRRPQQRFLGFYNVMADFTARTPSNQRYFGPNFMLYGSQFLHARPISDLLRSTRPGSSSSSLMFANLGPQQMFEEVQRRAVSAVGGLGTGAPHPALVTRQTSVSSPWAWPACLQCWASMKQIWESPGQIPYLAIGGD